MQAHEKINYVEYPAPDLDVTKHFFQEAFGWIFVDFLPIAVRISPVAIANQTLRSGE